MKSKIIIVSILIIFLFSIVAVSAIDDTNDTIVNNENILSVNNDEKAYDSFLSSVNEDENESIITENESIITENEENVLSENEENVLSENEENVLSENEENVFDLNSTHYAYWTWSKDNYTNFAELSKRGVTDIMLNYYAFQKYSPEYVDEYIAGAREEGINVHIWAQIFYQGEPWDRPIDRQGNVNYEFFNNKTKELEYYASGKGLAGIHYDYLRFSGSEKYDNTAWQNPGGTDAITYFVKQSTEAIRKINPDLIISAAIMPEMDYLDSLYGVDYPEITKYFDVVMPMVYRGNYNEDAAWVYDTTKEFVEKSQGSVVWTGLQAYADDDHMNSLLPFIELNNDTINALNAGAKGVSIFKMLCSPNIDFNNLIVDKNQLNSFDYLHYLTYTTYGTLNLEQDYIFNETTDNGYINGIEVYNGQLTINGNNHVIDAKNLARIFNITGNGITLTNIQFKNAFNSYGSALLINGNNVNVINCTFIDNFANESGAAVYIY
ncbi:MAG: hypothetical protein IK021_05755, partial [Methanobrevibacter sp.]|nr:hypothetical protein [Methanobrevibacter sp.]